MSQLTYSQTPGLVDIADSTFDQDMPVTDAALKQLNNNAKAAAVRCERFFMGFFTHGGVASVANFSTRFRSPVDGYQYTQAEVQYDWSLFCTRTAGGGFVQGQQTAPGMSSSSSGAGNLYWQRFNVNDATGAVECYVSYKVVDGAETQTNDGILKVYAVCQRLSVNAAN